MPFKCSIININTIVKTIVISHMMINSIIVNFMMFGMTIKIEECFFVYNCRGLMISNIKLIKLFTIVCMKSMKIMDMLIR